MVPPARCRGSASASTSVCGSKRRTHGGISSQAGLRSADWGSASGDGTEWCGHWVVEGEVLVKLESFLGSWAGIEDGESDWKEEEGK